MKERTVNQQRERAKRDMEQAITFGELLARLQKLTPEQLAHRVIWLGDDRGGTVKCFFLQDADQVCPDGESWEPRAEFLKRAEDYNMTAEEAAAEPVVSVVGQPYLLVD